MKAKKSRDWIITVLFGSLSILLTIATLWLVYDHYTSIMMYVVAPVSLLVASLLMIVAINGSKAAAAAMLEAILNSIPPV